MRWKKIFQDLFPFAYQHFTKPNELNARKMFNEAITQIKKDFSALFWNEINLSSDTILKLFLLIFRFSLIHIA